MRLEIDAAAMTMASTWYWSMCCSVRSKSARSLGVNSSTCLPCSSRRRLISSSMAAKIVLEVVGSIRATMFVCRVIRLRASVFGT